MRGLIRSGPWWDKRRVGLLRTALLVPTACFLAVSITEEQEFWCRTSREVLAFDYFSDMCEELRSVSMIEAMAEFRYKEPDGAQVGSSVTVTKFECLLACHYLGLCR